MIEPKRGRSRKLRLLAVDDTVGFTEMFKYELRGTWDVEQASCCRDAERLIAENNYDAYVLDWHLGDGDGLELAKEIRSRSQSVPILLLTADRTPEPVNNAYLAGIQFAFKDDWRAALRFFVNKVSLSFSPALRIDRFARENCLTEREHQVLSSSVNGVTRQQIATELGMSMGTIKSHIRGILHKSQMKRFADVVNLLYREQAGA